MASGMIMHRSICALGLLVLAIAAAPAGAADQTVDFQCCRYTPDSARILPGETVTFTGTSGADFVQHPLHFTSATVGDQTSGSTTSRTFAADGVYLWYCGVHGHFDGTNVSGMSGRVAVTYNNPPVASFTASATNVASGTEVTFDANGSSDPDFATGQTLNYTWDLDGDGADDPGATSPTPSAVFTNTGSSPRAVTVRLTATDTNADAVGPESSTKTMVITVQPPPSSGTTPPGGGDGGGGGAGTGPAADTTPPVVRLTLAKTLTVGAKLRLAFTSDEPATALATLKAGSRAVRARKDFTAAGRHTLTLKLSTALRRELRHRRRARLTLVLTDDAGNATTVKRTLRLKAGQRTRR